MVIFSVGVRRNPEPRAHVLGAMDGVGPQKPARVGWTSKRNHSWKFDCQPLTKWDTKESD